MTQKEFWEHIEKSKRRDPEAHAERLVARLAKLPVAKIIEFDRVWHTFRNRAYSWTVWGAAYLINGGCSDDGFIDFRSWLILQGSKVYAAAMKNPDSLAGVVDPDEEECTCECYPGMDAWFAATGTAQDAAGYDAWLAAFRAKYPTTEPLPSLGRGWNFDDDRKMRSRYPHLWVLYNEDDGDE